VIRRIKRAVRDVIERSGYVVKPTSMFGVSMSADLRRLMRNLERPTVIDGGANAGQWLKSIKRTFPNARVICYEPDERAFARLKIAAGSLARVECIQCALGDMPGRMKFFPNADSVTSSLLPPVISEEPLPYANKMKPLDGTEVEVRALSDELARLQIQHVDLLKTDCQGFDLRVLQGAAPEIERGDVDLIATETLFHREYENQSWFHETLPWLSQRGYALIGIYDTMHAADGRMLFGDALFARSRNNDGASRVT
jgi:FkbM family methyltransferase